MSTSTQIDLRDTYYAFFRAVRHNDIIAVQTYLLTKGISIGVKNDDGENALLVALKHNNIEIAKWLISEGINIHSVDKYGNTALHFAAQYCHRSVCEYLVDKDADPITTNTSGLTPAFVAIRFGRKDNAIYLYHLAPSNFPEYWYHYTSQREDLVMETILTHHDMMLCYNALAQLNSNEFSHLLSSSSEEIKKLKLFNRIRYPELYRTVLRDHSVVFLKDKLGQLSPIELRCIKHIL